MALVFALTTTANHTRSDADAHAGSHAAIPPAPARLGADPVVRTYEGYLDFPFERSHSYWQNGRTAGTEQVVVDGPPDDHFRLTVDCPGSHRSAAGMSQLSVVVESRAGRCVVTVAASTLAPRPVPFDLTMGRTSR
jgi:hypothetical protein